MGPLLLAAALAAPACAFHDERGVVIHSSNATPKFEAAGKPWFDKGEKIAYAGGQYGKYGLPRQLNPAEVEAASDYQGVPLFIEAGNYVDAPEILYVMVRSADCSFQPYGRE
jgi:hypothetical protein